jgi:hypothetical protein
MLKTRFSSWLDLVLPDEETNGQVSRLLTHRTVVLLAIGAIILVIIHICLMFYGSARSPVHTIFNLDSDTNIPAWYSSMMLAVAAILAFECSGIARKFGRNDQLMFFFFCMLLVLMSCDEIVRFHETIPERLKLFMGMENGDWFDDHPWVVLGGPSVAIVFGTMGWLLYRVMVRSTASLKLLFLGFSAIILGGVVLESAIDLVEWRVLWKIELIVEESLEMTGTLLICSSLITWRDHVHTEEIPPERSAAANAT